jgi:hypothetical protein
MNIWVSVADELAVSSRHSMVSAYSALELNVAVTHLVCPRSFVKLIVVEQV